MVNWCDNFHPSNAKIPTYWTPQKEATMRSHPTRENYATAHHTNFHGNFPNYKRQEVAGMDSGQLRLSLCSVGDAWYNFRLIHDGTCKDDVILSSIFKEALLWSERFSIILFCVWSVILMKNLAGQETKSNNKALVLLLISPFSVEKYFICGVIITLRLNI